MWLTITDFTKQYNRMKQLRAATEHGPENLHSRPPVPARNRTRRNDAEEAVSGVVAPAAGRSRASAGKQTKDKSDRATQDQVMDSRTRMVISNLTNRGVIGRFDRCISSGKEVCSLTFWD